MEKRVLGDQKQRQGKALRDAREVEVLEQRQGRAGLDRRSAPSQGGSGLVGGVSRGEGIHDVIPSLPPAGVGPWK